MPLRAIPSYSLALQPLDLLHPALGAHRPAQQVGVVAGAAADRHGDLHQLLLEQRHAHGPLQHRLQRRVQVGDLLPAGRPAGCRGAPRRPGSDRAGSARSRSPGRRTAAAAAAAGCRPGPGSPPGTPRSSRPGRACRRRPAPPWGWCRASSARRSARPTRSKRVLDRGEDAEAEEVELDQPHPGAGVLVPLQHGAVVHPAALDRAHLADRPLGQHHAAGVDAEMPRRRRAAGRPGSTTGCGMPWLGSTSHRGSTPQRVDLLGPGVLLAGGVAERLGHVADRRLRPVADHVRHLRGVAPAVAARRPTG